MAGITGPIVALLIGQEFSPEMQGYYYTFNSLLAMSVFLELGFNGCIIQFISHEYAHLSMEKDCLADSSPRILGRLASLTRLSLKWYMGAGVLLLGGVGLAGEFFFRMNATMEVINWRGPWWCLCALSAVNLMLLPLSALLDGCDQVNWTARARILQNFIRSSVLICGLLFGLGLYAPAAATLCGLLAFVLQFHAKWRLLLVQIMTCPVAEKISWVKEILPMQWRIAVSWGSGYFIFSIFNPLLFCYQGAESAGRFGMTWVIYMAINSISQAFVSTRGPKFGSLIARAEWAALRKLWKVALIQAVTVNLLGCVILVTGLVALKEMGHPMRDRMIDMKAIIPLCVAGLLNQGVFTVAILARAEKREPFLWASVFVALVTGGLSFLTVKNYSIYGVAYSYLLGACVGAVFAWAILNKTQMMQKHKKFIA